MQSESPSEVVVQLGATTTKVPTDQIQSIRYDGQSASFTLGEAREVGGQLAEAAELFKKAAAESAGKPFPLQAALFREAEVLTELALVEPDRIKEAKEKLTKFVQAYPASRHIVGARALPGAAPAATPAISPAPRPPSPSWPSFPRAPSERPCCAPSSWPSKASTSDAIAELDKLIAGSPKGSERQRAAQLAKAESLAGMKQFKEAETLLARGHPGEPRPKTPPAQAPAYNTLGDCLRAANRPKDALLAYLHTDLLYSKDKEEHPRALHQIAVLFPPAQARRPGRRICPAAQAGVSPLAVVSKEGRG